MCYYSFWVSASRNLAGLLQRVKVKSDLLVLLLSVTWAPVAIVQLFSVCWNHYLKVCSMPVLNCAIRATKLQERNREWDLVTLLRHCLFTTYTWEQIFKCLFLIVNNSLQSQVLPHTSKSQNVRFPPHVAYITGFDWSSFIRGQVSIWDSYPLSHWI